MNEDWSFLCINANLPEHILEYTMQCIYFNSVRLELLDIYNYFNILYCFTFIKAKFDVAYYRWLF